MKNVIRRTALGVVVAALVLATGAATPAQARSNIEHCVLEHVGDLNERYDVSYRIITATCSEMKTGERWVQPALWVVNTSFEAVPDGFVAAGATPLDDFRAKFTHVRYVVDPGTKQQRTYIVATSDRLWVGDLGGLVGINTVTLTSLHPLRPGQHAVEVYWNFSAVHCDGLAANEFENCLPAGEFLYTATQFSVSPG